MGASCVGVQVSSQSEFWHSFQKGICFPLKATRLYEVSSGSIASRNPTASHDTTGSQGRSAQGL